MGKTAPINLMVEPHIKKDLKAKAKAQGLNLTQYLEKIASQPIIFVGPDLLQALSMFIPKTSM